MLQRIDMFPVIGSVFRLDASRLGSGDFLAGPEQQQLEECIRQIVAPGLKFDDPKYEKKIADVDHLVGHHIAGRDILVTDDRDDILKRASALQSQCGIRVMSPSEALELIERSVNQGLVAEDFRKIVRGDHASG
jgi:hypothetical protein